MASGRNEDDSGATLKCMCGLVMGNGLCICMYLCDCVCLCACVQESSDACANVCSGVYQSVLVLIRR